MSGNLTGLAALFEGRGVDTFSSSDFKDSEAASLAADGSELARILVDDQCAVVDEGRSEDAAF